MFSAATDECYRIIAAHYGEQRAKRSGERLMKHIDDGLAIMAALGASRLAMRAYCLHPIAQMEPDKLDRTLDAAALAMDYARAANAYLAKHPIDTPLPVLSTIDVKHMLIADKVQNRHDFERHHRETHPRARELDAYFKRWLAYLEISDDELARLRKLI